MNESRDYSQTVFPAVVVVDDAPVPRGTKGTAEHIAGDVWRFTGRNFSCGLFRLQITVTVPERPILVTDDNPHGLTRAEQEADADDLRRLGETL